MKVISFEDIVSLGINPEQYYGWVNDMLLQKQTCILPPKVSMKQLEHSFCNVMPCVIPSIDSMGVKVVTRYPGRVPSISSQILLYRISTGELVTVMDGTYITAMRTGAVAAHSVMLFAKKDFRSVGVIGLGNTARAAMEVLARVAGDHRIHLNLYRYKNHAEQFILDFKQYPNLDFSILDSYEDVIQNSDVILSCVTYADGNLAIDNCFPKGCTVIPVHTRGFQNCDLFFDKVFADDESHVEGFQYFKEFKSFMETSDVIAGRAPGRESASERILVYNIGISIHDIYFATKIYEMVKGARDIELNDPGYKFWVSHNYSLGNNSPLI